MKKSLLITQEQAHRAVSDAISLRIGRGKRHSVQAVADASGVPTRCIESYRDGSATPGVSYLLSLCEVLGPSFTSDILRLCGQSASDVDQDDPQHMQVLAALSGTAALIAEALADGKVDHREAAQLRPVAAELIEMLGPLARPT